MLSHSEVYGRDLKKEKEKGITLWQGCTVA